MTQAQTDSLEHDSLDDRKGKALKRAPANKMIEAPAQSKAEALREARREQRALQDRPHLHPDNPEIWDGEIE